MMPMKIYRKLRKRLSRYWLRNSHRTVIHAHINDYDLLVLANEEVGRAIHFGHKYESPETKYLQGIITRHSICVDVGANVGYFTMLMAKGATAGKVYAFEPIPLNASLLRASLELNGFENVEVVESAVGEADGYVDLSQSIDSAYSSIRDTARKAVERVIHVPIARLDTFVRERSIQSIDLLKVDVEGAEGLVLLGSQALLDDALRRPSVVLMELFDENLSSYDTNSSTIIDTMKSHGYEPFFATEEGKLVPFRSDALDKLYNVLFLAPEPLSND